MKVILVVYALFLFATQTMASISADSDAEAAEASILLREGKFDEALKQVNQGLAVNPASIELSEVKGLALLGKKDEAGALAVFEKLKLDKTLSPRRLAGYQYQIGVVQFQKKNFPLARKSFSYSLNQKFNETGCHYYLGAADLEEKKYDSARVNLLAVLQGEKKEFHYPARLYLAQLSNQLNDGAAALRFYGRSREEARLATSDSSLSEGTRALARQVVITAERDLRAYEENLFFANVGLFAGYDSNILLLPASALSGAGGTGSPSGVGSFRYGVGYATSPLSDFQIVANYSGNANLNSSLITQSAEFFTHDVSLYFTKNPLSATNYGFKVQGLGILQYQKDPTTANSKFALYGVQGAFGPYYRTDLTAGWLMGVEALFQPQKFYLDQYQPSSNKRSGFDVLGRFYVTKEGIGGNWNPSAAVSIDYNQTVGEEFRSKRMTFDFSNTMYLSPELISSVGVTFALLNFSARPAGVRNDQFAGITGNIGYRLTTELTTLLNLQYQNNFTNTASYRYSRILASFGATYAF